MDKATRHAAIDETLARAGESVKKHFDSKVTVVISPIGVEEVKCENDTAENIRRFIALILREIDDKLNESVY